MAKRRAERIASAVARRTYVGLSTYRYHSIAFVEVSARRFAVIRARLSAGSTLDVILRNRRGGFAGVISISAAPKHQIVLGRLPSRGRRGRRVLSPRPCICKKVRSHASCVYLWWSAARPLVRLVASSYLLFYFFVSWRGRGPMGDAPMAGSVEEQ